MFRRPLHSLHWLLHTEFSRHATVKSQSTSSPVLLCLIFRRTCTLLSLIEKKKKKCLFLCHFLALPKVNTNSSELTWNKRQRDWWTNSLWAEVHLCSMLNAFKSHRLLQAFPKEFMISKGDQYLITNQMLIWYFLRYTEKIVYTEENYSQHCIRKPFCVASRKLIYI